MLIGARWSLWTETEDGELMAACQGKTIVGKQWEQVAKRIPGRSALGCCARWKIISAKVPIPQVIPNGRRSQTWTQDEARIAFDIWQEYLGDDADADIDVNRRHRTIHRIANELDREYGSVSQRLKRFGATFGFNQSSRSKLSAEAVADREARYSARQRRDITASFFGDPAPGFSALDQKQQEGRSI